MIKKKNPVGRPRETFIDDQIIGTIRVLFALKDSPVQTGMIADCLRYSSSYLRVRLTGLEQRGMIQRVGHRKGWVIR